jgi:hypothetical protein
MTPADIRRHLLRVQRDALRQLREEIVAYPPANAAELLQVIDRLERELPPAGEGQQ